MKTSKSLGYVFVILSALCFAIGGLLIKLNTWSAITIHGVRSLFAFGVMLAFMILTKHAFKFNLPVFFGALANFGMGFTFVLANKLTSAANAIVLQFTMPAFIILLLWVFWKKKPDMLAVVTVLVSFIGICFFFFDKLSTAGLAGNLIAIFSGLLYAIVFLLKKIPGADFESSALVSFVISFVVCIPFLIREPDLGVTNWITVVLLGILQMGMAYVCLNLGLNAVPPVAASLISMIEPIINPILVAIFYKERITIMGIIGSIIVLSSALVYNLLSIRMESKAEAK